MPELLEMLGERSLKTSKCAWHSFLRGRNLAQLRRSPNEDEAVNPSHSQVYISSLNGVWPARCARHNHPVWCGEFADGKHNTIDHSGQVLK